MPLKQWLGDRPRGAKSALAKKMGLESQAVITNWLQRGVPMHQLEPLCRAIGMDEDAYRLKAGGQPKAAQRGLDAGPLLEDFESLPPAFRVYVASIARRLRSTIESVPPDLRQLITAPPTDPERYGEWERGIAALIGMAKRR